MQRITSSKLAEMLNEGFEGEIMFSGSVRGSIRNKRDSNFFYESNGNFILSVDPNRPRGSREAYILVNNSTGFHFKPKGDKPIEFHHQEGYGDVIAFPIDLAESAFLQIEPREIRY